MHPTTHNLHIDSLHRSVDSSQSTPTKFYNISHDPRAPPSLNLFSPLKFAKKCRITATVAATTTKATVAVRAGKVPAAVEAEEGEGEEEEVGIGTEMTVTVEEEEEVEVEEASMEGELHKHYSLLLLSTLP